MQYLKYQKKENENIVIIGYRKAVKRDLKSEKF